MVESEEIVTLLRKANEQLPRGKPDFDQWRSVWMMLVGACHLLAQAQPYLVGPGLLDLDTAESFATQLLNGMSLPESEWAVEFGPHPWISGFYVLSAEHRIANSIDRLTKVFAGAKVGEIPGGTKTSPYPRCEFLASDCPHCRSNVYANHVLEGRSVLQAFREARDVEWPDLCLARVYKRVNELKHQPNPERSRDATIARSSDASRALREVSTVLLELVLHRNECSSFLPL